MAPAGRLTYVNQSVVDVLLRRRTLLAARPRNLLKNGAQRRVNSATRNDGCYARKREAAGGMFSYVSLEERVPGDHPLRPIRRVVDEVLGAMSSGSTACTRTRAGPRSRPSDCCGPCCCRSSTRSQRADADGAAELQPAVPVVRGTGDGRAGVEPRGVQQEPGAVAEQEWGAVLRAGAGAGPAAPVGRALHGGWHVDRGLGQPEELSNKGRRGRRTAAARAFTVQQRSNDTHESKTDPEARLYRKGRGQEAKLELPGARADGESERPDRGRDDDPSRWHGRSAMRRS